MSHQTAWHGGVLTHSHTHYGLATDLVPWEVVAVFQSTIRWHLQAEDVYPSAKCTRSYRHPLPLHVTWSLHPSLVDAVVDVHGRSHNFPLNHPRKVLMAWCWMVTRPLSTCGIISLSLPLGVGLTGAGLVHLSSAWQTPTHKGMPVSDAMRRSQLWCRKHDCPHWFITSYKGTSIAILSTTLWCSSFHLSLIFLLSLKGISLY